MAGEKGAGLPYGAWYCSDTATSEVRAPRPPFCLGKFHGWRFGRRDLARDGTAALSPGTSTRNVSPATLSCGCDLNGRLIAERTRSCRLVIGGDERRPRSASHQLKTGLLDLPPFSHLVLAELDV